MKAFADDTFNVIQMAHYFYDRVENIVGKGKKYWLPAFSSFPLMFLKGFPLKFVRSRDCVVKSFKKVHKNGW